MNDNLQPQDNDNPVAGDIPESSTDDNDDKSNTNDMIETDNITYAPWKIFNELGLKGRVLVIASLIFAITVVTIFNLTRDITIFEAVSNYLTVLFLLWLGAIDAKSFLLPNKILLAWFGCRMVLMLAAFLQTGNFGILVDSVAGAVVIGLFFLITYYLSKRTLGGGDVKLSFVLGLSITISMIFPAVFIGLVFCAAFSLVGLATKKLTRKDIIPLGPFLFIGTVMAYFLELL